MQTLYPTQPAPSLLTGLLAWYRNNGTDRSGNGRTLTASGTGSGDAPGTAAGVAGDAGAAASFNGTIACFWFLFRNAFTPAGACSFALWFRVDAGVTATQGLWGQSFSNNQYMGLDGAGTLTCKLRTSGGGTTCAYANAAWTHVAVSNDGATSTLYKNGVQAAQAAEVPDFDFPVTQGFVYGSDAAANFDGGLVGRTEHMAVWSRALSQADVTRLYAGGVGFDPTA